LQQNDCTTATVFTDKYATDFDVVDAPELEKATVLRIKRCEKEMRDKELASLETGLQEAKNECAIYRSFEKQNGLKLSPDRSNRLTAAEKQRCDFEDELKATLRTCLDRNESGGNFCGGVACYRLYRDNVAEGLFAPYRQEADRQSNICNQFASMRSCFSNDPCDGDRCSYPLRLAVGTGALMSYIERNEKDAVLACNAKRERERWARQQAEEAERRRQEELRAQERRNNTFQLTVCNDSDQSKIWIAFSYYDYDASNWIRQGGGTLVEAIALIWAIGSSEGPFIGTPMAPAVDGSERVTSACARVQPVFVPSTLVLLVTENFSSVPASRYFHRRIHASNSLTGI
jgi:hypothetical protein